MKSMALIGVLCASGTATAFAQPVAQVSLQRKCTSTPCGNTATGEDPSEIAERQLFEKGNVVHAFSIASPLGKPDNLCPAYAVSVVDAGFDYAVIQVNCFLYQFAPKRFYGSEEFFLYDMQTASMRSIWDAGISDNSVQGPLVSPKPTMKKISNGYTLIWNVKDRSKSATETYKVFASYIRHTEKNGTHPVLTCTDLTAPKGENIEVGICEGTHPKLVSQ